MASASLPLSDRLAGVVSFVEQDSKVIDVGTDHAYVPIWLLLRGVCRRCFASDNKSGPLRSAEADAKRWGVADRLTLYLCDGLAACSPNDVDTVIVAGMGGDTIRGILSAAPWALQKRLILQPQTHPRELAAWLAEQGVGVAEMRLACDAGRYYAVWLALPGAPPELSPVHPSLLRKNDSLLRPWLEDRILRTQRRLYGMEQARHPEQTEIARTREELSALRDVLARVKGS